VGVGGLASRKSVRNVLLFVVLPVAVLGVLQVVWQHGFIPRGVIYDSLDICYDSKASEVSDFADPVQGSTDISDYIRY
jgi:hypothetical protein